MPLHERYTPEEVREVLAVAFTHKGPERPIKGDIIKPAYYENEHALVLDPATDIADDFLQDLESALRAIRSPQPITKQIIIPVAEQQKILGIVARKHWVTLHYDPEKNTATLLDSRPWYISFLYPSAPMLASLKAGLATIYDSKTIAAMKFQTYYQAVQYNDRHCGAWTTTNIRDLAGANLSGQKTSIDAQKTAYSPADEPKIVAYNIGCVAQETVRKQEEARHSALGWWQRFLIWLGYTAPEQDKAPTKTGFSGSHATMTQRLGRRESPQLASDQEQTPVVVSEPIKQTGVKNDWTVEDDEDFRQAIKHRSS